MLITRKWVRKVADEEFQQIQTSVGEQAFAAGRYKEARELFAQVALADDFVEFLTLPAYERLTG